MRLIYQMTLFLKRLEGFATREIYDPSFILFNLFKQNHFGNFNPRYQV